MRTWKRLALVAVFGFAGCGDDVTQNDASADFSVPGDMTMSNADHTVPPDIAQAKATAQLTLADIVGTFYTSVGGTENPAPLTHVLFAQQSLKMFASNPQYIDSDFSTSVAAVHGCTANRYNLAAGNAPAPDADAGIVTYSGYATNLFSADARTPPGQLYPPPIPSMINCAIPGASVPFYVCGFGAPSGDLGASVDGEDPNSVVFPMVPAIAQGGSCTGMQTTHVLGGVTYCEQHPMPAGTTVVEAMSGGNEYGAVSTTGGLALAPIPSLLTIVKINNAAPANPADPLAGIVIDGSADLTIQWSCDGNTTTVGSGCPTGIAGATELVGLLALATNAPRSQFAITPDYGTAQCAEQLGSSNAAIASTVTLKAAAQQQLLQGQAANTGSILVALVSLNATPTQTMGHNVFFTAGAGNFALLKH